MESIDSFSLVIKEEPLSHYLQITVPLQPPQFWQSCIPDA